MVPVQGLLLEGMAQQETGQPPVAGELSQFNVLADLVGSLSSLDKSLSPAFNPVNTAPSVSVSSSAPAITLLLFSLTV